MGRNRDNSHDLIEVATIFSRPEMLCFVAALKDAGVPVFVGTDHYAGATLDLVLTGGYRIHVPGAAVPGVIDLIDELRGKTDSVDVPDNLKWGVRALVGFWVFVYGLLAAGAMALGVTLLNLLFGMLGAFMTPVPMIIPGDYMNRRGKLVQMR